MKQNKWGKWYIEVKMDQNILTIYTNVYEIQKSPARLKETKGEGHGPSWEKNSAGQGQREKKSVLSNHKWSLLHRAVKETFKISFLLVAPFFIYRDEH